MIPESLNFDIKPDVTINRDICTNCGLCARVCTTDVISLQKHQIQIDQSQFLGCIGCGQCISVCPTGAINLKGRRLDSDKLISIPDNQQKAQYDQLYSLLLSRRSIRQYQDKKVDKEIIDKIIDAVKTAPVGVPPSDVSILVFDTKEKVHQLRLDIIASFDSMKLFFSKPLLTLMKLLQGEANVLKMEKFVKPLLNRFLQKDKEGLDYFFYNAPLAMFFYTSAYNTEIDPIIAATYAMIAGESLGLGSCMLGFPGPTFKMDKKLRQKYHLPDKMTPGIVVIFGYKDVKFTKTFVHELEDVKFVS